MLMASLFHACAFAPLCAVTAGRTAVSYISMAAADDGMIRENFDPVSYDCMPYVTRHNSRFVYGSVPSAIWDQARKSSVDQHISNAPSSATLSTTWQPSRRDTPGLPLNDGGSSTRTGHHVPAVWKRLAARQAAKLKGDQAPRPTESSESFIPFATTKPAGPASAVVDELNDPVLANNLDSQEFVYASIPSPMWDRASSMQGGKRNYRA